ncbi:MAG: pseudaminic acid synthase [Rhodospirillaceae bacterium]|mgnify:FL=1|jgi:N-acetylneuraminate synthase/N,N'-diacetyllegionaminate synthase|nr:pseudaminic acid synthase [Rhodospirillaceae bacterium]MBT3809190.1 pseudaminic acid synthase [Rhodospirillaceae bacterium]MBT3931729.1 pseudaminic acid synthase [Rhodospirillaceae bacterium]MBT4773558.1 pseudaminic acid synthase [Rhodospirillaceae bacterium]MBT5358001.1 pseudaminic acid synthase [Rhodospirillaceae bacterium]
MPEASFKIGSRTVGAEAPCFVIAEIGVNHEGSLDHGMGMVEAAARAGADAIKLQTALPEDNYAPDTDVYRQYAESFLSMEDTGKIFEHARTKGLAAFTTTGLATLPAIEALGPDAYKVSSGTLSNHPLLEALCAMGRPVLLSTGMSDLEEVDEAVRLARMAGADRLSVLQCTSLYPAPPESLNLASIRTLADRFDTVAGFSDHSLGIDACVLAVAAGAKIIEKHFTFDSTRSGWDHPVSVEETEFRRMMEALRAAETCLGSAGKPLSPAQHQMAMGAQRYIVARHDIEAGAQIELSDLLFWRLQDADDAFPAKEYRNVVRSRAAHAISGYKPLSLGDIE